ncbi:right-handed parallel beta-helix repeat-containing protein [Chitinophaga qingshengii]|uniref:Right-handed parallel beta-helix repeat-containing protein n=1 Tax=Chitinophaga qingshengii TaxID=1569794 RepID=A0ABR7TUG7_9BACT|nr:right-handed parallel beta-helix repeat-containing protein [Chitinophaga qingshengii]MBC9933044.1 right-handed parallel beta-helix repeat-containing protein [Chitinophaga qingshengii]
MKNTKTSALRRLPCLLGAIVLQTGLLSSCYKPWPVDGPGPHPGDDVVTTNRYYIDDNGSDTSNGRSPATAWKTLAKVNTVTFQPGDSVLFKRGGSWTGTLVIKSSGAAGANITFGAYGSGDKPRITGNNSTLSAVLIQDARYLTFENFDISHPRAVRPPDMALCGIYVALATNGAYPGISIKNNDIHDVEGMPITNRHMQAGIFVRSNATQAYFDSLLIENNHLERCSSRGIMMGDGTNKDTTFYNNHVTIRKNMIDNTALEGIIVYTAKNVLIEHNRVLNAGAYTLGVNMNIVLAGLWGRGKNMLIQYNEVAYTRLTNPVPYASMDSEAFDIDLSSPGYTIIQYNYSHDNAGGFFLHMGDPGPDFTYGLVRYNISQNDGNGFDHRVFELHGHPNGKVVPIYFYNNTIYNDTMIGVMDRGGGTGIHPGLEFRNNIFYAPQLQFDDQANILYNHNLYYPGLKAASDSNALTGNPLLAGPGTGGSGMQTVSGYKLSAGSPAFGAGVFINNNGGRDFFGIPVPVSGAPTVGAAEKE